MLAVKDMVPVSRQREASRNLAADASAAARAATRPAAFVRECRGRARTSAGPGVPPELRGCREGPFRIVPCRGLS